MPNETSERVKKLAEGVFTSGSPAGAPQEGGVSTSKPPDEDLLIAVIVLGVIVFVLIVVIIYGYFKWVRVRGKRTMEGGGDGSGETTEEALRPPLVPVRNDPSEHPQVTVPVKMRKRSMTFSETDEECRKYREDLADSYAGEMVIVVDNGDRSRKKSFVTFAGVEEIDVNDA